MKKFIYSSLIIIFFATIAVAWRHRFRIGSDPVAGGLASAVDACQIFTPSLAQQLLGRQLYSPAPGSGKSASVSHDLAMANCSYTASSDDPLSATLTVRTALTAIGARSNDLVFMTLPAGAQKIAGYGDGAFWDSNSGQLSILSHHNWYLLSHGGALAAQRSLDQALKLADLLKTRL